MPWDNQVSFHDIQLIENTLNCNIYVIDLNKVPIIGAKIDIWNTLMYKTPAKIKTNTGYYLTTTTTT
jgi:hypothetical protein